MGQYPMLNVLALKPTIFLFISYIAHLPEIVSHIIDQYLVVNSR